MGIFLKEIYFVSNPPAAYSGIGSEDSKDDLFAHASLHPRSHFEHLQKPGSFLRVGDTTEVPVLSECAFWAQKLGNKLINTHYAGAREFCCLQNQLGRALLLGTLPFLHLILFLLLCQPGTTNPNLQEGVGHVLDN